MFPSGRPSWLPRSPRVYSLSGSESARCAFGACTWPSLHSCSLLPLSSTSITYHSSRATRPDGQNVPFVPGKLWFLEFPGQRTYYYVVLGVLALVVLFLSRLRNTGAGRTIKALRDNEVAATAYGVRPVRLKLQAFALSGTLAGLGGALLAGTYANIAFTQDFFLVNDSLNLVCMVVIGGMGSVSGAVIGAIVVIGVPALAPNNALLGLLSSSLGLLIILLYFPRGLNQLTSGFRDAILAWADRRLGDQPMAERPSVAAVVRRRPEPVAMDSDPVLTVKDVTVQFGGLRAVDKVCIDVHPNEIVGLIGANGAGKSTLMNAVGGFIPSDGAVSLLGEDVSDKSPGFRASLGLGRTFQSANLFPELTVNETLLVALEARDRTLGYDLEQRWVCKNAAACQSGLGSGVRTHCFSRT